MQCGCLTDKFGVRWQIVPDAMIEMMKDPDAGQVEAVMAAMMEMVKLDVARLKEAYEQAA